LCAHVDGFVDGPFIPTEAAARAYYLIVERALDRRALSGRKIRVMVRDQGDFWEVFEGAPVRRRGDRTDTTMGVGGLQVRMDKCSGALSHVAYSR
jgi:hypothetical protein